MDAHASAASPSKPARLSKASCSMLQGFFRVALTLLATPAHQADFKVIVSLGEEGWGAAGGPSVLFLCLNAAIGFRELASGCRSVLITSGTLSPLDSFAGELGVGFAHRFEGRHVIADRQVCVWG